MDIKHFKKQYFFYKDIQKANNEDRDCVEYIEINGFDSGRFSGWSQGGAAHWGGKPKVYYKDNMITCLTRVEIRRLIHFNRYLNNLGWQIKENDNTYFKGIKIYESIKDIIDKLSSNENKKIFKKVVNQEMVYIKNEYNLSYSDIKFIFDNYYSMYRDRAVISYVFDNIDDCAREEAESLGYTKPLDWRSERYFDFDTFGQDLLQEDQYLELSDGRIVYLNY